MQHQINPHLFGWNNLSSDIFRWTLSGDVLQTEHNWGQRATLMFHLAILERKSSIWLTGLWKLYGVNSRQSCLNSGDWKDRSSGKQKEDGIFKTLPNWPLSTSAISWNSLTPAWRILSRWTIIHRESDIATTWESQRYNLLTQA